MFIPFYNSEDKETGRKVPKTAKPSVCCYRSINKFLFLLRHCEIIFLILTFWHIVCSLQDVPVGKTAVQSESIE